MTLIWTQGLRKSLSSVLSAFLITGDSVKPMMRMRTVFSKSSSFIFSHSDSSRGSSLPSFVVTSRRRAMRILMRRNLASNSWTLVRLVCRSFSQVKLTGSSVMCSRISRFRCSRETWIWRARQANWSPRYSSDEPYDCSPNSSSMGDAAPAPGVPIADAGPAGPVAAAAAAVTVTAPSSAGRSASLPTTVSSSVTPAVAPAAAAALAEGLSETHSPTVSATADTALLSGDEHHSDTEQFFDFDDHGEESVPDEAEQTEVFQDAVSTVLASAPPVVLVVHARATALGIENDPHADFELLRSMLAADDISSHQASFKSVVIDSFVRRFPGLQPGATEMPPGQQLILSALGPAYETALVAIKEKIAAHTRGISPHAEVTIIADCIGGIAAFDLLAQRAFTAARLVLLACPLAAVLQLRRACGQTITPPAHTQIFNVFQPLDPLAHRLEPLLETSLAALPPMLIEKLLVAFKSNAHSVAETVAPEVLAGIRGGWWGTHRLDYQLGHAPKVIQDQNAVSSSTALYASYWENVFVGAFITRQIFAPSQVTQRVGRHSLPSLPRRPSDNVINHRAADVFVLEGTPQTIAGSLSYPLLSLGGRMTVTVLALAPDATWTVLGTGTARRGKFTFTVPDSKRLTVGTHTIRLSVDTDGTFAECMLQVLPRTGMEAVIFSIDGSFASSFSISGTGRRTRAGAVSVVNFWLERGFSVIYVTRRPVVQKNAVLTWLRDEGFPAALSYFVPSLSRHLPDTYRASFLRTLADSNVRIAAAYGAARDLDLYCSARVPPTRLFLWDTRDPRCTTVRGYQEHLQTLQQSLEQTDSL
eukprot:m.110409 g.110409  ORF g.110409 m.110409 type:complete len:817 (+) comp14327_c7_seq2:1817-4267(+)